MASRGSGLIRNFHVPSDPPSSMIPSNSNLSVKNQGSARPSSSLSSRPPSGTTSRTPTSFQRPISSLSTRPGSSASTRPQSRFSQRPSSRHARSRLIPICQTLVTQLTGLKEDGTEQDADGETFREQVEYAVKNLEAITISKASASTDMTVVDKQISGHALKARLNSRDALGKALQSAYNRLKTHIAQQEMDLDHDIKTAHIPDHLQFLLALSWPPTDGTVEIAKTLLETAANPPPPPPTLTWADILAEEPFEGEHWEGVYGLPTGSVRQEPGKKPKDKERDEWDSTPSLSPLNSDDLALDEEDSGEDSFASDGSYDDQNRATSPVPVEDEHEKPKERIPHCSFEHRKQLEELQKRQYWREDWQTDARVEAKFDLGEPSTLGPTLNRVLAEASGFQDAQAMLKPERYIDEEDMVREVLMALQGNKNVVLTWLDGEFKMTTSTPRLIHLSLASQESIISSLAETATIAQQLRRFACAVFSQSISRSNLPDSQYAQGKRPSTTRTCEAFADAVDHTVRGFDAWCAAHEEAMCRASAGIEEEPLVVSLLSTEKAIRDEYATLFEVLLDIINKVFDVQPGEDISSIFDNSSSTTAKSAKRQPAALTALLLDTLFANVQQHLERRDHVTGNGLMRVFVTTTEPVWDMVGRWLRDGMGYSLGVGSGGTAASGSELEDEFFIESSGVGVGMMGLGLLDPEFWQEGYSLREGVAEGLGGEEDLSSSALVTPMNVRRKAIPLFLEHVADLVLGTGKAVGLMRALDGPSSETTSAKSFKDWGSFSDFINLGVNPSNAEDHDQGAINGFGSEAHADLFSVSIDTLSSLIYDGLLPHCQATSTGLVRVLVDDCALWKHLGAIEDLFLMRKGDAMSHFVDVLFTKMDSQQPWGDLHFLNTAFGEVMEANSAAGAKEWINAALVRFTYRGSREKDRSIRRTVKAIDGLVVEYAAPFPLTYIFQPNTIQGYSEIFAFLLQIRRAKSVLERILVRDERGRGKRLREELKVFYAMRSRLSWFINTLLNFLTTYVIHAEVSRFHESFHKAQSLDEMIQLHNAHLEKIRGRCLLKPNTSALHRAILSALDMCLHFSEGFVTFAGDTTATLDVSRQSSIMKRHRSRRQRRQRKNVIAFSQVLQEEEEDSSDDDEEGDAPDPADGPAKPSYSMLSNSTTSADEDFFARVERMASELDGLVRFLRRGVESLAGGTSEAAPAFGVLAFALEDWDI
ncbi:unnamed protein product [Cyclocybe aegerita]|uniref:Spindle pole body component n=1 Tax=Cyclocybe aegerita TaxID=1973307 RepID=A0A8S0VVY6_CYCAE|nr:unnamed protein product [Cyclocybe aegerita]